MTMADRGLVKGEWRMAKGEFALEVGNRGRRRVMRRWSWDGLFAQHPSPGAPALRDRHPLPLERVGTADYSAAILAEDAMELMIRMIALSPERGLPLTI